MLGLALLCSNRPVIHRQPPHWKVAGIAGRQARSYTHCRSRDETVRLAESHAASGKLAPPPTGLFPLNPPEWRKPQAVQKVGNASLFVRPHSPEELFYVDGAGVRTIASGAQPADPGRGRPPA
jgi:hypothetical protein